jgi:AcrR family transcriptional regulator
MTSIDVKKSVPSVPECTQVTRRRTSVNTRAPSARTREERKLQTRQAIIDAAMRLLAEDSFSGLSLREVTREAGIVPGAFYRHFESMEALGLVLIDESFRSLRDMLRDARSNLDPDHVIESSIEVLSRNVEDNRLHWRFITRERNSGVSVLRYAIRAEIRLITSELATDLARFPALTHWKTDDLNVLASLFVNAMVQIAEALEDTDDSVARDEIRRTAVRQLRMIVIGIVGWRS